MITRMPATEPPRLNGPGIPAPSAALVAALAVMKPVRPRVPQRALLLTALAGFGFCSAALLARPVRPDLALLPPGWVVGVGLSWLLGFVVPLGLALLPRHGQVAPDGRRAAAAAALAVVGLVALTVVMNAEAIGVTASLDPTALATDAGRMFWPAWRRCMAEALSVSLPTLVVGAILLRRVALVGAWRLGAALGAAGGALGGLTLHLSCAVAGTAHAGWAHGLPVALAASLGSVALPALCQLRG